MSERVREREKRESERVRESEREREERERERSVGYTGIQDYIIILPYNFTLLVQKLKNCRLRNDKNVVNL